ncbi:hypothetical protein CPLU01_11116 [Colletotrichum plurivorum]|uniref:Uncharacterized protein n=1 Tax=Colletotrichum plurivorum TaxID=2175906 RepID=A0A8H6K333_9PEZI|nr:hypothetical protein CPLU01_11116 [Colletotrichum plurivorum]
MAAGFGIIVPKPAREEPHRRRRRPRHRHGRRDGIQDLRANPSQASQALPPRPYSAWKSWIRPIIRLCLAPFVDVSWTANWPLSLPVDRRSAASPELPDLNFSRHCSTCLPSRHVFLYDSIRVEWFGYIRSFVLSCPVLEGDHYIPDREDDTGSGYIQRAPKRKQVYLWQCVRYPIGPSFAPAKVLYSASAAKEATRFDTMHAATAEYRGVRIARYPKSVCDRRLDQKAPRFESTHSFIGEIGRLMISTSIYWSFSVSERPDVGCELGSRTGPQGLLTPIPRS